MIIDFKIFENIADQFNGVTKLLCVNNHIGILKDKYNLTVGKMYKIKDYEVGCIIIEDNIGEELFFSQDSILSEKNFTLDQSMEEYELRKNAEKFGL